MEIVAVDIGGTNARFALAQVADGRVTSLGEVVTQRTADQVGFVEAWRAFGGTIGRPLPRAVSLSVALPVGGDVLAFTNNPWTIRPALLPEQLGVDRYVIINDFAAVAHAVAQLGPDQFVALCGPDIALPETGAITICGPGTGLGVAQLIRRKRGYDVIPTEGGHLDFAPLDAFEEQLNQRLRVVHGRVSVERVVAGPAIVAIYETLAAIEGRAIEPLDDRTIWSMALAGSDPRARMALDRFCRALGAIAGDLALAHGPTAVVIAGGLGLRLKDVLPRSGFAQRFTAKGRFAALMRSVPVKIITHPQPGLLGAAAAFAQEYTGD